MTNIDLTSDDQWVVMWALRDSYLADARHRDDCRALAEKPFDAEDVIPPAAFAGYAAKAEERLAVIDAIVAKFPEMVRNAWAEYIAKSRAEQKGSAA